MPKNPSHTGYTRLVGVLLIALLGASGCADPDTGGAVWPAGPDLEGRPDDPVQGTMWRLADEAGRVEAYVTSPGGPAAHRAEIAELLDRMARTMARLEAMPAETHPRLITERGGAFREEIEQARRDVLDEPPRYERVRGLYAACRRCHG